MELEESIIDNLNKGRVEDIITIEIDKQPVELLVKSSDEVYENLGIPCTECFFRNKLECLDLHCVLKGVYYKQLNIDEE